MGPTMDAIGRIGSRWGEWPCCDGRQPHEIIKCNPRKETRTEANKLLADMVIRCESLIILVANWLMRQSSNAAGFQHVSLTRLQRLGSPSGVGGGGSRRHRKKSKTCAVMPSAVPEVPRPRDRTSAVSTC